MQRLPARNKHPSQLTIEKPCHNQQGFLLNVFPHRRDTTLVSPVGQVDTMQNRICMRETQVLRLYICN